MSWNYSKLKTAEKFKQAIDRRNKEGHQKIHHELEQLRKNKSMKVLRRKVNANFLSSRIARQSKLRTGKTFLK